MGKLGIVLNISNKKANLKMATIKPDAGDIGVAITQLLLVIVDLVGKSARLSKINRYKKKK